MVQGAQGGSHGCSPHVYMSGEEHSWRSPAAWLPSLWAGRRAWVGGWVTSVFVSHSLTQGR